MFACTRRTLLLLRRNISFTYHELEGREICRRLAVPQFEELYPGQLSQIAVRTMASTSKQLGNFQNRHELKRLKNVKMRAKRGGQLFPSTNVTAQVIGSGSRDSPASVLIIADSTRFLFNCGEGTQRLLMECGVKSISRLEHIFFTRMSWENLGGAIGMMITLKKIGLPKLTYYGPENLRDFTQALQIFAKQDMLELDVKSPDQGPFTNEAMVVHPVTIKSSIPPVTTVTQVHTKQVPDIEPDSDSDTEEAQATSGEVPKKRKGDPLATISGMNVKLQPWRKDTKKRKMSPAENVCVAYVCKLHDKDGKILVDKAMSLGLKPGPEYSLLKKGESVTTEDGKVIKPEDVVGPKEIGPTMIVLECPSEDFIDSLTTNPTLQRHHQDGEGDIPAAVIHITPPEILEDTRYQDWVNRFNPSVEHIVCNRQCNSVTHLKSRRTCTKLNLLHPEIFPLPTVLSSPMDSSKTFHYAKSFERFVLKPRMGWDREHVQTDDPLLFLDEVKDLPDFSSSLDELKVHLADKMQTLKATTRYPEVVFLGTGSAMPNRERNVSGIMLHISEQQNVLMDCGEGTFNQICRFYGDKTDEVMSNLRCIFISHRHADHHVGLLQILKYWKTLALKNKDNSKAVILVAPKRVFIWLNQYNQHCEDIIHQMRFVEVGDLCDSAEERSRHEETILTGLNLEKFETVPVKHCSNAYGLAISHNDGWKIVYSGDTMPCDALVTAGKNADLLIHEATLEDGMSEEAVIKKHSMISEAIDIGERMDAKFIMLTHFSQRYPKVPLLPDRVSGKVGIAFDFMRFCLSEVDLVPLFMPTLKHLFAEQIQELMENKMKKAEKEFFKVTAEQFVGK
ncbi:Zinc phosphodiesterase ELAC protein 2 [Holothuria leucospilota]|uniref:Zinc phosphodiesterase ELAC protein 2 n=1 Tax=Holothuria leucospilota TaxID=206669 RepID=A0A9Q1C3T6_HOLLE|nr:Zinc phosphodiesterase ELAC protein 2 [Holothuria leucospilota]